MIPAAFRPTRCIDGRIMRHDPQPDDPSLETDIGVCEECRGDGCQECEGCKSKGYFAANVEAFELTGKVLCEDCASEAFEDAADV